MEKQVEFNFTSPISGDEYQLALTVKKYANNRRPHIRAIDMLDGMPYMTVTYNFPELIVGENEVIVKGAYENRGILEQLISSEIISSNCRPILGHYGYYFCEVIDPILLNQIKEA